MYSVYNLDTDEPVARGVGFPRSGVAESARRDPSNLVSHCPPDLKGPNGERYGWLREVVTEAPRDTWEVTGERSYEEPDFDAGTVAVTAAAQLLAAPAEPLTQAAAVEEQEAPLEQASPVGMEDLAW